jgi:aspartyl-tRNA(Asn)/glutamyl-tRNA(Gln) amidotransferase subunit C
MALTLDQVRHVAKLAELELSQTELERLATDLSAILAHVDQLQSVPTNPSAPVAGQGVPQSQTHAPVRLRADEPRPGIAHERALLPSPKVLDEGFAVPAFVDD